MAIGFQDTLEVFRIWSDRVPDRLAAGQSQEPLGGRVEPQDPIIRIQREDSLSHALEKRLSLVPLRFQLTNAALALLRHDGIALQRPRTRAGLSAA